MSKPSVRKYKCCYFFKSLATVVLSARKTTVFSAKKQEMYFHDKLMLINCIVKIPPHGQKNTCTTIFEVLTAALVGF
jgi:hypothetical protein